MVGLVAADPDQIRKLPHEARVQRFWEIFKNDPDEAARWDAVWLAGETAEEIGLKGPIFDEIGKMCGWVLRNDENSIVRHEVCYQIAGRAMKKQIPDLLEAAIHDKSDLVRHEATECLSIIHAHDESKIAIEKNLSDPSLSVRETAIFVQKRMERIKNKEYDRMVGSF
jgi:HEAT repeat protein